MLKIIRIGPPTRTVIKLQHGALLGANSGDFIHKDRKYESVLLSRRSVCLCPGNSVPLEGGAFGTNGSLLVRPKQLALLPQIRHFSFQSSVESFAATQSGIFKTISESTPVEYCQKYLLFVHDFTGLPWWASIILSTIIVRSVVTLPLAIYQQCIIARLENLKLELPELANELKRETAIAVKMYNWDEKTARMTYNRSMRKQWNDLLVRDNCHPLKTTILLWVQIPLWVSISVSLRNLVYMLPLQDLNAQLIFAEFVVGGCAFIPNLTIPDASWILPVSLGILNYAIIEMQILSKNPSLKSSKTQKVLTNIFRGITIFMIPIAASVPSCLALYWTTSSAYGLVQNLVLLSPRAKRLFRIPQTTIEVKEPYKMLKIARYCLIYISYVVPTHPIATDFLPNLELGSNCPKGLLRDEFVVHIVGSSSAASPRLWLVLFFPKHADMA